MGQSSRDRFTTIILVHRCRRRRNLLPTSQFLVVDRNHKIVKTTFCTLHKQLPNSSIISTMKFTTALSALLAVASSTMTTVSAQNIVEVAQGVEDLSTLVELVVEAGLADTLATTPDLTVFAPTNAAFEALPAEAVAELLTDPWLLHLQDILTYHVTTPIVPASVIIDAGSVNATMLNDETITAALVDESVVINGESTVVTPDVTADNGIVHVVDTVLLPSWLTNSIVDRAVSTEDLSSLVDLVTAAGLVETLAGPGPFTVFAPTNDAVAEAVAVLSEALGTTDIPPELLTGVLTYHVVPGIYSASAITEGLTLPTVQGEELTFSLEGGASVNGNSISATDILANNGIVHIIDGVLLPPSIAATLPTTAPAPVAPEAPVDGPTMAPVESETTPAPTMMEDMDTEVPSSAVSRSVAASAFAAAAAVVLAF